MDCCREVRGRDHVKREGCPSHGSGFPCGKGRAPLPLITHESCFIITDPKPFEPDPISLGRETAHFLLLNHANLRLSDSQPVLTFLILSQISQASAKFLSFFPLMSLLFVSPHFLVEIFGWWTIQERMAGSEEGCVWMQWEDQ